MSTIEQKADTRAACGLPAPNAFEILVLNNSTIHKTRVTNHKELNLIFKMLLKVMMHNASLLMVNKPGQYYQGFLYG